MRIKLNKLSRAFALTLLLTMTISILALPQTSAHTPSWTIYTYASITVAPDLVGVGQTVSVVMWLDKPYQGALLTNDARFKDYKLTITAPDGKNETMGWQLCLDPTSSQYTSFVPDQVGTYTLKFEYPGQTYTQSGAYQNDKYFS